MKELMYDLKYKVKMSKDSNLIDDLIEEYHLPAKLDMFHDPMKSILDKKLIELYSLSDGFTIKWTADILDEPVEGRIELISLNNVLQNWENRLYDTECIETEDLITKFKPFDLISTEAQCGIIKADNFVDEEIYLNFSKESTLYGLDLNFEGYMRMAVEAGIFQNWPKVLYDIKNKEESFEVKLFNKYMPNIFPDFSFSKFEAKYQSIRLSNREEDKI